MFNTGECTQNHSPISPDSPAGSLNSVTLSPRRKGKTEAEAATMKRFRYYGAHQAGLTNMNILVDPAHLSSQSAVRYGLILDI